MKYFASSCLAREASTIYEVDEDGSFRAVSPQGQEHQGSGELPAAVIEVDADEALRLIAARTISLERRERAGLTSWGPVPLPDERLLDGAIVTDEWRAREEWRNNGWGTGVPNDKPSLGALVTRFLRALRRRSG